MSNSFNLTVPVKVVNPNSNIDSDYGPYMSLNDAIVAIPYNLRAKGKTVGVIDINGYLKEYWWDNIFNDNALVEKNHNTALIGITNTDGDFVATNWNINNNGSPTFKGLITLNTASGISGISFPNTNSDPGFIERVEISSDATKLIFSIGDNNNEDDYFAFGNTQSGAFDERFKITANGIVRLGIWSGTAIADAYISSAPNWTTAYTQTRQWDGGSTGLIAATGRTSLGLVIGTDVLAQRTFGTAANYDDSRYVITNSDATLNSLRLNGQDQIILYLGDDVVIYEGGIDGNVGWSGRFDANIGYVTYGTSNKLFGWNGSNLIFGDDIIADRTWVSTYFHPLENQRLSKNNDVVHRSLRLSNGTDGVIYFGNSNKVLYANANVENSELIYRYSGNGSTSAFDFVVLTGKNFNSYSPTLNGTGASGTWGINITGNAATATNSTQWNGLTYLSSSNNSSLSSIMGYNGATGSWSYYYASSIKSFLSLSSAAYLTADVTPSGSSVVQRDNNGHIFSNYFNTVASNESINPTEFAGFATDGYIRRFGVDKVKEALGLGSNAYSNTAYLPLVGGSVSGNTNFYSTLQVLSTTRDTYLTIDAGLTGSYVDFQGKGFSSATYRDIKFNMLGGNVIFGNAISATSANFSGTITGATASLTGGISLYNSQLTVSDDGTNINFISAINASSPRDISLVATGRSVMLGYNTKFYAGNNNLSVATNGALTGTSANFSDSVYVNNGDNYGTFSNYYLAISQSGYGGISANINGFNIGNVLGDVNLTNYSLTVAGQNFEISTLNWDISSTGLGTFNEGVTGTLPGIYGNPNATSLYQMNSRRLSGNYYDENTNQNGYMITPTSMSGSYYDADSNNSTYSLNYGGVSGGDNYNSFSLSSSNLISSQHTSNGDSFISLNFYNLNIGINNYDGSTRGFGLSPDSVSGTVITSNGDVSNYSIGYTGIYINNTYGAVFTVNPWGDVFSNSLTSTYIHTSSDINVDGNINLSNDINISGNLVMGNYGPGMLKINNSSQMVLATDGTDYASPGFIYDNYKPITYNPTLDTIVTNGYEILSKLIVFRSYEANHNPSSVEFKHHWVDGTKSKLQMAVSPSANSFGGTNSEGDGLIVLTKEGSNAKVNNINILNLTGGNLYFNGSKVITEAAGNAVSATRVGGLLPTDFFNNMGQNHTTTTDFNVVSNFGFRFIQGTGNGPGTGSSQFYSINLGLGADYPFSSYGIQIAIPRDANGGDNYLSIRRRDESSWKSWNKISAGYADNAGSATNWGGYPALFSTTPSNNMQGIVGYDGDNSRFGSFNQAQSRTFLGLDAYVPYITEGTQSFTHSLNLNTISNTHQVAFFEGSTATNSFSGGDAFVIRLGNGDNSGRGWQLGADSNGVFSRVKNNGTGDVWNSWARLVTVNDLGSNAYSNTAYLPIVGGTLLGTLSSNSAINSTGGINVIGNGVSIAATFGMGNYSIFWSAGIDTDNNFKIKQASYSYTPLIIDYGTQAATFASTVTATGFYLDAYNQFTSVFGQQNQLKSYWGTSLINQAGTIATFGNNLSTPSLNSTFYGSITAPSANITGRLDVANITVGGGDGSILAGSANFTGIVYCSGTIYSTYFSTSTGVETSGMSSFAGFDVNGGNIRRYDVNSVKGLLGLGSNAYSNTAYLPLTGGTLNSNASLRVFNYYNDATAIIGGDLSSVDGVQISSKRWGGGPSHYKVMFGQGLVTGDYGFFIKTDLTSGANNGITGDASTLRFNIRADNGVAWLNGTNFYTNGNATFSGALTGTTANFSGEVASLYTTNKLKMIASSNGNYYLGSNTAGILEIQTNSAAHISLDGSTKATTFAGRLNGTSATFTDNTTNQNLLINSSHAYGTSLTLTNISTGGGVWAMYSFGLSNTEGAGNFGIANASGTKFTLSSVGNGAFAGGISLYNNFLSTLDDGTSINLIATSTRNISLVATGSNVNMGYNTAFYAGNNNFSIAINGALSGTTATFSGLITGKITSANAINIIDGGSALTASATYSARHLNSKPNQYNYGSFLEFKDGSILPGGVSNYIGVMTIAPYNGTTSSTGDPNYQLAFATTVANGALPRLSIRSGIDTTWNTWYDLLHAGNFQNYALPLTGGTVTGNITMYGNIYSAGSAGFSTTLTVNGSTYLYGTNKIVLQNAVDGTNAAGLAIWSISDTNWALYMGTSGTSKSYAGGTATACTSLDGRTSHHIRMRCGSTNAQGFIWENNNDNCLMSLAADTGSLHLLGSVNAPNFFKSSDRRLKTELADIAYNDISNLKPHFYLKNGIEELGYYAQEAQAYLPHAVKEVNGYLQLSYEEILVAKVAVLENKIKELENKIYN